MVIDCHGHYTTAPQQLEKFRQQQIEAAASSKPLPPKSSLRISDDEIRESVERAQLRIQRERGTDLTLSSC